MSDDWAKKVFNNFKSQSEAEQRAQELEMQKAALLSGGAPRVWEALGAALQRKGAELNEQFRQNVPLYRDNSQKFLKVHVRSNFEVVVTKEAEPQARLSLEFDPTEPAIKYELAKYVNTNASPGKSFGKYQFMVSRGQVCLREENVVHPLALDAVAEKMLEDVAGL